MSKVILITGASSGIGKVTASRLIDDGYVVYCGARRVEEMNDLKKKGGKVVTLDVTDQKSIERVIAQINKENQKIDVLVNNAGFGLYGAVEDIDLNDARYQFEVNLFGVAALTKAVLPIMRKQRSGTIINISSMGGKMFTPLGAWYHSTKYAMEGWSDCLRLELKQFGINVVIVEPGIIKTAFGKVAGQPILDNSGKGPYKNMAKAMANSVNKSYRSDGKGSNPEEVYKTILKIIKSDRPRTRYVVGYLARPLILARKYLSDRMFDRIVLSQVK
ncbi:SDR family NAD(P)-dependent oxidoreductase [Candidatus Gracilibacteria bacterium]|nr:SDR family NAD(P)-dependent oxidoreductase [Thermales bacterium]NJL96431.1 SDR family NAD(P)-dependent oxidoreductase [Candidatus Gracilibacteria bacterium]